VYIIPSKRHIVKKYVVKQHSKHISINRIFRLIEHYKIEHYKYEELANMKKIDLGNVKNVHFIGIGGSSMSGLAEVLQRNGYSVTGSDSDATKPRITGHLQSIGIPVAIPNAAENITDNMDLVVYTAAVRKDNPEYQAAATKGKTLMERAELLGQMLKGFAYPICIAGTHGKTSTTALMAEILLDAGFDPTISLGAKIVRTDANFRVGKSDYFLLEGCEYNNSYHHWHPQVGVILNIDADHLDFFGTFDNVVKSFRKFAENIPEDGTLVIQQDTPGFDEVTDGLPCEVVTFGLDKDADFYARNIKYDNFGRPCFDVMSGKEKLAHITLPIPGRYNILNALAAFAAGYELGIPEEIMENALANAKGAKRRFEIKGNMPNGALVIDDYAHHPTEIESCLAAVRSATQGKVICLFQPHTYTRTRNHLADFAKAFKDADEIMLLPIYAAREPFDPSISSLHLLEGIKANGGNAIHLQDFDSAADYLRKKLMPNDMLITMGAGDVYFVGEGLLKS